MLDDSGTIIYVGKAKNLKNRVRQYFSSSEKTEKVKAMVKNVADFYYIITPSEIDALSLENNLIKKHKPRYNILLKDDKTYPFIRVDLKEDFPCFKLVRKVKKDGAKYFGPFMGGISVRSILETINLVYLVRPCDKKLDSNKPKKPCLNSHLGKCLAPCALCVSREEYRKNVLKAIDFLSGDIKETENLLKEKMFKSAENEEFESALKYKEILFSLGKVGLKRITALNKFVNLDVIGFFSDGIYSSINVLLVRNGRMLGGKNYAFERTFFSCSEALREFITQYYQKEELPDEIVTSCLIDGEDAVKAYFKQTFLKSTTFTVAKGGVRKELVEMSINNAEEHLSTAIAKIKHKNDMTLIACKSLKEKLNLKNYPHRMECYDISNISGVDKVGSMVVFIDGEKSVTDYRRFKIKTVEGANDFKSLQEVLRRRLNKLVVSEEKFPKPDLIVIDGGKGQLSAIKEVFDEFNIENIDLISLAEREEEIFLVGNPNPVVLDKRDYCLKMLQRLRDEAHRFAITYHRTLRGKRSLSSVLDGVNGLGKVKKKALLEKFKDLQGVISASQSELQSVHGIGEKQAKAIIEKLTKEGLK